MPPRMSISLNCGLQLVRRLQGQDGEVAGEEVPATPKKNFQLLNQVKSAFPPFVCHIRYHMDWL